MDGWMDGIVAPESLQELALVCVGSVQVKHWILTTEVGPNHYWSLAIDVIAAMLEDDNKRFLISFYC